MKKLLFVCLLICMMIMNMSATAFALTEGDWEFNLVNDEVRITNYLGHDKNVVVPSTLYGAPVTEVVTGYKKGFAGVVSLEYPGTVKDILGNGVDDSLESLKLNEGTEIICERAFSSRVIEQCKNLKTVNLPSTIKEIRKEAFRGCKSLESINIPSGIQTLGSGAFMGTKITTIDLSHVSNDCIRWSDSLFESCSALKSVKFNNYSDTNFEFPDKIFRGCNSLEHVNLPNNITKIGESAFEGCQSLKNIILPTSVKEIDEYAFKKAGLEEVVIPYGVTQIGYCAFSYNSNLKSLYVPDTVKSINSDYGFTITDKSDNCIIYCPAGSYAARHCETHKISYLTDNSVNSPITVYYNGTRISFHEYGQNPELINDRTLVPLRAIFEAMGADVQWDQMTQTVTSARNGVTIKLTIGDNTLYKNGQSIPVDVPAQIINDRTMVPARVIAEAFGADVEWNGAGQAVLINE